MSEPRTSIRIGTAERESATAALDTHLREGRLDADEYGERYALAVAARTQDELTGLFADLPQPHAKLPGRSPRPVGREHWWTAAGRRIAAMPTWLIVLGLIAVVSATRSPWLFGGVFFWIFVFPYLFGGRRNYGGCGSKRNRHSRSGYEYPKADASR